MDGVGDQLFTRARLATHEYRGVGSSDLRDLGIDLPHRTARAHDVGEVVALLQLLTQMYVLFSETLPLYLIDALREFEPDTTLQAAIGQEFSEGYLKLRWEQWRLQRFWIWNGQNCR